jgi:hypothetical protein
MATVSKKEIIQRMEALKEGALLSLRLGETYGGGAVIIELNPSKEKGQKKYLMWWGDNETKARSKDPFMSSDKAKTIADWPATRMAEWIA